MGTQKSLARSRIPLTDRNVVGSGAGKRAGDNMAYYRLLSGRLELLLQDIGRTTTPSDDDLVQRLEKLLAEARGQLAKHA